MGTQMASDGRPLPWPNPTTQPFFDAASEGRLDLQRCPRDGFFFYPRSHCPTCLGNDWAWETVSGQGKIAAVTIDRQGHDPALAMDVPYVVALIQLEEGPTMMSNIVNCDPDSIVSGMGVEVVFENWTNEITMPQFQPVVESVRQ